MLNGWSFYKTITIKGSSGVGTNHQVKLLVGESSGASGYDFHVEGHSAIFPSGKNDSGDLRFTDTSDNLLDFWVEDVSGDSPNRLATIWVKVSANLDTDQDILCYYGNSNADNVSNGDNTFDFFDDFDESSLDTNKWKQINGNTPSFSNSQMTISANSTDPGKLVAMTAPTDDNYVMRAKFKVTGGTDTDERGGVGIKTSDSDGKGYNFGVHDFTNLDEVGFLDDGVSWNTHSVSWEKNVWYIFEVIEDGNNLLGRYNDGSWYSWDGKNGRAGYPALNIGSKDATTVWEYAAVRKYTSTEPSFNSASSEVSAFKISGQVTLNGVAVSGAIVRVIDQNGSYFRDTATDSNGYYSIGCDGTHYYHVVVEYTDGNGNKYNAASLWDIQGIKNT